MHSELGGEAPSWLLPAGLSRQEVECGKVGTAWSVDWLWELAGEPAVPLFCVEPRGGFILPTRPQKAGEGAGTPCPPVESREGSVRVRFPLCHPRCWALSTQDLRLHPNSPSNSETDGKWKPDVKVLYTQSRRSAWKHRLPDLQKNWGKPMLTSKTLSALPRMLSLHPSKPFPPFSFQFPSPSAILSWSRQFTELLHLSKSPAPTFWCTVSYLFWCT